MYHLEITVPVSCDAERSPVADRPRHCNVRLTQDWKGIRMRVVSEGTGGRGGGSGAINVSFVKCRFVGINANGEWGGGPVQFSGI